MSLTPVLGNKRFEVQKELICNCPHDKPSKFKLLLKSLFTQKNMINTMDMLLFIRKN